MDSGSTRRLLILGCSKSKRQDDKLLPAIERYDGPAFRVVRRYMRGRPASSLDIRIISARFGLIQPSTLIPAYDQAMTKERASQLQPAVLSDLGHFLQWHCFQELFFHLGQVYLGVLAGWTETVPSSTRTWIAEGTPGKKLSGLYTWLYGLSTAAPNANAEPRQRHATRLCGVDISMTPKQVLDCARRGFAEDGRGVHSYHAWYVSVDGERVGVKWLVCQMTAYLSARFILMTPCGCCRN